MARVTLKQLNKTYSELGWEFGKSVKTSGYCGWFEGELMFTVTRVHSIPEQILTGEYICNLVGNDLCDIEYCPIYPKAQLLPGEFWGHSEVSVPSLFATTDQDAYLGVLNHYGVVLPAILFHNWKDATYRCYYGNSDQMEELLAEPNANCEPCDYRLQLPEDCTALPVCTLLNLEPGQFLATAEALVEYNVRGSHKVFSGIFRNPKDSKVYPAIYIKNLRYGTIDCFYGDSQDVQKFFERINPEWYPTLQQLDIKAKAKLLNPTSKV